MILRPLPRAPMCAALACLGLATLPPAALAQPVAEASAASSAHATAPAAAASTAAPAASAPQPYRVGTMSVLPMDPAYPPGLASRGVQGTAEVLVRLDAAWQPAELSILSTSRSEALDEAARNVVKALSFKVENPSGPPPEVIVPVNFRRDSLSYLQRKTCAEFNVDLAYFKATFPEQSVRDMPVVNMTVGAFVANGFFSVPQNRVLARMKSIEVAAKGVADACSRHPDDGFIKTFRALVDEAG